jgi:tetratricopeptide (TPR) repeat protein
MRLFKESLGYNRQTGNAIGTKIVCHALSRIAQAAGDQLRGQEYAKLAAQYGQATGTARERFFNAFQQAKVLHQQGRTAEARTILEEPLRMAEANKMPELGLALGLLGQIEEAEGRFDAARMAYERALELDDAGGSRPRAINLYRLARLAHRQNDFQNAEGLYLDSYSEAEQANDALGMKSALHGIGRLCEQNERPSEARTYYERQLKLLMMDPHGSEIYIMKAREAIIRLGGDPGPEPHFASYGAAKNRSNKSFSEEPGIKIMPDTMQVPDKWLLLVRGDAAFFRELEIAAQGAVRRLTSEFPSKFADYEKGIYIMAPDEDLLDWIASFARARGMQVSYQRRSARRSDH